MNKSKKRILGIITAVLLVIPFIKNEIKLEVTAATTSLVDSFIREQGRHYAEPQIYINSTEIISMIPERPEITDMIKEAGEDYYNLWMTTAPGFQLNATCDDAEGPFKVALNLTRGSDIKFNFGNDSNGELYEASYAALVLKTSEIDYDATVYDIQGVEVYEPSKPLGIDYTDESSGTTMSLSARPTTPSSWWSGYDKVLGYQSANYNGGKGTMTSIDLKGYTLKPKWDNLVDKSSFTLAITYLSQVKGGDVTGTNVIQNIEVTFNIVEPTTAPLQAPALTLEPDADNGGLKYTVTDSVNNGKASSYAIDLFSDAECSTKVGNTINVASDSLSGTLPLSADITAGTTYYAKVKAIGDGTNTSDSPFSSAVSAAAASAPAVNVSVSFSNLTANGSVSQTTSELTLTFDQDITGLTADKITLSGIDGAAKGSLTKEGTGVYKLGISNVTASGSLNVTVGSIDGYTITPASKTVNIYYAAPKTEVAWTSAAADGEANKKTSTKIDIVFDKAVTDLKKENFTLTGADITSLSGSGTTYSLSISNVTAQGNATLSITSPSGYTITPTSKTVPLNKKADPISASLTSVTADGNSTQTTTKLTLTFDKDIAGLTADHIQLSNVSGIEKGVLTKEAGTGIYSLPISGFTANGTVSVSVSGVEGYSINGTQTAQIYYYKAPQASAMPVIPTIAYQSALTTDTNKKLSAVVSNASVFNEALDYEWYKANAGDVPGEGVGTAIGSSNHADYAYPMTAGDYYYYVKVIGKEVGKTASTAYSNLIHVKISEPLPVEKFTIHYEMNGGTDSFPDQQAELNTNVTIPNTVPEKEGHTFKGWKVTGSDEIKQPGDTITSGTKQTITLTAQWTKDDVAVSFSNVTVNGTANTTATTKVTVTLDKAVAGLTKDNFTLTNATIDSMDVSGNVYTLTISNVTTEGNADLTLSVPAGYTMTANMKTIVLHKDTRINVNFTGLSADGNKNQNSTTAITMSFDKTIPLTMDNIRITDTDGTGAVKGMLSQQGNDYVLTLNNIKKSGKIRIEIVKVPDGYTLNGNGKEVTVLYVTDSKKPETVKFYDQVIDNKTAYTLKSNVLNTSEYDTIIYAWYVSDSAEDTGSKVSSDEAYSITLNDETKYYTLKVTVTEGDNKAVEYTAGTLKVTANALEKYTVDFNLNGGTGSLPSISQSIGTDIVLNGEEPVRANYKFNGWKDAKGNSYAKNSVIKSPETAQTLTLTAQWKAEESGNTGGGTGGGSFGGSSKNEGWKEEKDGTYYYENGKLVTGFKEIEKKTYYFNDEGKMVKGFSDIKNKTYYFDEKGVMKKADWFSESRKRYYAYADGVIAKGWLPIESDWYYMNPTDGHLMKDWVRDGSDWYFMGPEDGKLWRQHWAPDNSGNWYYVDLDGKMIVNTWIPSHSGYWYYIGSDGKMVSNAMVEGCWINSLGIYQSPTYQG